MPANPLFSRAHSTFYQHVLSTLKVDPKKIEPLQCLDFQGSTAVFINTFCPLTLYLSIIFQRTDLRSRRLLHTRRLDRPGYFRSLRGA